MLPLPLPGGRVCPLTLTLTATAMAASHVILKTRIDLLNIYVYISSLNLPLSLLLLAPHLHQPTKRLSVLAKTPSLSLGTFVTSGLDRRYYTINITTIRQPPLLDIHYSNQQQLV